VRVSYGGIALVLGLFFVVSTTVVGAQVEAPADLPIVGELAASGPTIELVLAEIGLDASWRSTLDLHPAAAQLEVKFIGAERDVVEALIRTSLKLSAATTERGEVIADLRLAAATLDDAEEAERGREIDRNRADAYFQGIHALTQSVAIDRFAGRDPSTSALLGLDGKAQANAQREFELTNTTLDEMFILRTEAETGLEQAIADLDAAVQHRVASDVEHQRLIDEAASLATTRRSLDASARATLPDAAESYALAHISGQPGLTPRSLSAYLRAESAMAEISPSCHVSWRTLAAVGSVEGRHGEYNNGRLGMDGRPVEPIIGLALNGQTVDNFGHTTALLVDTDNGRFDGDPTHDRAVGPMQFIPQTWQRWQFDGDGDGEQNPHDIDDAALAAGAYLCNYGSLRNWENWSVAIFGYNHSGPYVNSVKASLDRVLRFQLPDFEGDEALRQRLPYGTWVPHPDETLREDAPEDGLPEREGVATAEAE
jgi:membrane-bound lytic murein transglycosylase B